MSNKLEQVKEIINTAGFSAQEKLIIFKTLFFIDENREEVLDTIIQKPEILRDLINNYQKKLKIIKDKDKLAWRELLKEEGQELEELVENAEE